MDNDTTLQERYDALVEERDTLEGKIFNLAGEMLRLLEHTYTGCAVHGCYHIPDWDNTELPLCHTHLQQACLDYEAYMGTLPYAPGTPIRKPASAPAVYYIRMNGKIKIGTTINLRQRMASLYAQPEDLLAVEPGGRDREAQRHKQFKASRQGQTELFESTPELLQLIAAARETFGDPSRFLNPLVLA